MTAGTDREETLFEGHPAVVASVSTLLLVLLTLGLWLLPAYLQAISKTYRVTSKRIVVETGILGKRLEQIDLYRVSDYTVDRPFLQRLMGTGNLHLKTVDRTTPNLSVVGIKTDVVALYERLRQATEADKVARGVRMVDYE
jgi:uncharacterized membrane protein YdbT with pleckstrin-like domain